MTSGATTTAMSPFTRRDVPPGGGDGQFPVALPTTIVPPCGTPGAAPSVHSYSDVELLDKLDICLAGFGRNAPVEVAVTAPGGQVTRLGTAQTTNPNNHALTWRVLPSQPLGTYQIRATQGSLAAPGSVTVKRASVPRALTLSPAQPAGSTFGIAMAGFGARATVLVSLFADRGTTHTYLSELPPIVMDQFGEALLRVETRAGDPPGSYCVSFRTSASEGLQDCRAGFSIRG